MNTVPIPAGECRTRFIAELVNIGPDYSLIFQIGAATAADINDILTMKTRVVREDHCLEFRIGSKKVVRTMILSDQMHRLLLDISSSQGDEDLLFHSTAKDVSRTFKRAGQLSGIGNTDLSSMRQTWAYDYHHDTEDIFFICHLLECSKEEAFAMIKA